MNALALLLAAGCVWAAVIAARDTLSWVGPHWRRHKVELVTTALIFIVLAAAGVVLLLTLYAEVSHGS